MKLLPLIFFITAIFLLPGCSKTEDAFAHTNCDGIITDTLGTGDTARIYMANAFTPNNDGLNDSIRPYTKDITSLNFIVYDDHNNEIFSTSQLGKSWEGPATITSGTLYYYKIQATTGSNHQMGKCGAFFTLTCQAPRNFPVNFEDQITADGFTLPTTDSLPACP